MGLGLRIQRRTSGLRLCHLIFKSQFLTAHGRIGKLIATVCGDPTLLNRGEP